jgi:hypothetical protein
MSFSAWGFHDHTTGFHGPYMGHHHHPPPMDHEQLVDLVRIDTRLTTIEEGQQEICNTLHQYAQWQEHITQTLTDIHQHQQQEHNNWNWLFDGLNIGHPLPPQ